MLDEMFGSDQTFIQEDFGSSNIFISFFANFAIGLTRPLVIFSDTREVKGKIDKG